MAYNDDQVSLGRIAGIGAMTIAGIGLLIALGTGADAALSAYGRSQDIADAKNQAQTKLIAANNNVQVTQIEISNQAQQLKVHQQQAQIRLADAVGVREAQDEIAKTLTPMYLQFEQIQAMQAMAASGRNNTVIYVPAGQGGVPTITAQAGTGK